MSKMADLDLAVKEIHMVAQHLITVADSITKLFSQPTETNEPAAQENSKPLTLEQVRGILAEKSRDEKDAKEGGLANSKDMYVTQEMRQKAYDNYETTDDHGMQIYGIAKDQLGKKYYMVKNSWGTNSRYDGIWYASEAFVAYKTMNIVVHKDAIPKAIKSKLGLK